MKNFPFLRHKCVSIQVFVKRTSRETYDETADVYIICYTSAVSFGPRTPKTAIFNLPLSFRTIIFKEHLYKPTKIQDFGYFVYVGYFHCPICGEQMFISI
uniref:Uncharacterized protein n=1 Tax=Cacopsylla melanoneura TaxID=428564 RepID=A0A8D8LBA2_9HEMI